MGGAARPGMFAAYAARSAREIELQALALLAALAQNLHTTICRSFTERSSALRAKFCGGSRSATRPSIAPECGSPSMARDGGLGHVPVGAARPGLFAPYAAWAAREIELQALATL